MSPKQFHSIPHGNCLIETIVEDFARRPVGDLQQTLLLLPTRRLQLHVAAHLASRAQGASWLPRMMTWDQYLQSETFPFLSGDLVMVSSLAELILADQLKESGIQGISERHAHELLHFLKELWRNNKRKLGPDTLTAWLERQWQMDPDAMQEILNRTSRIYSVLDAFDQSLHQHGFALHEEIQSKAFEAWLGAIKGQTWRPVTMVKRTVIAGLTSLPETQLELLRSLAHRPGVECWLDTPWQELSPEAPLRRIRREIHAPDSPEPSALCHVTRLQSAIDPFTEAAVALERAQAAVDGGIPAHRVGILVPDESQYASVLALLSQQLNVSRNIPLARPWAATRAGSWLEILLRWVSTREAIAFAALLENSNSRALIFRESAIQSNQVPDFEGDLSTFVSSWLRNAPRTIDSKVVFELSLRELRCSASVAQIFRHAWNLFCGGDSHSFEEHANHWQSHFAPVVSSELDARIDPIERMGWQSILDAELAIQQIPKEFLPHTKSWAGFVNVLIQLAKETTPRETGEPLADLQIISITEARYVPLDVAIIVGCVEGIFPHRVPRDSLIDQTLHTAFNLPGWQQLEALEDSTFGLLVSRIAHVELLWPEFLNDASTVRSRWVEKIHALGIPIIQESPKILTTLFEEGATGAEIFELCSNGKTTDLEGQVLSTEQESLLTKVSASSLRALMTCPYQFLMRQRGIRSFSIRDHEDPLLIGNLLHHVIELCLKPNPEIEAKLDRVVGWRVDFKDGNDFELWSSERLRALSEIIMPKALRETPEILQIVERTWPQLAQDWSKLYSMGWHPLHSLVEHKFGDASQSLTINLGPRTINVTGAIDVIHRNPSTGEWLVCDYKSGNAPNPAAVRQGLEPQLILYSMCLEASHEGYRSSHGVISYRSLKSGIFQTVSVGCDIRGKWSEAFGDCRLDLSDLIAQFTLLWQERIDQIESNKRFFATTQNCGFCDYSNICRKDDPRYQERLRRMEERPPL